MDLVKTCTTIYNPVASNFDNQVLEKIVSSLKAHGIASNVIKSNKAGHVIPLVKKYNETCDLIITMGGDGTVGEAVQGFHGIEQHALYTHLSTGTANDVVANYRLIPGDMPASLEKILNGSVQNMDYMTVNGTPFAYISAFGYVTNVPYATPNSIKRRFGYPGYLMYSAKELAKGFKKIPLTYTKDGEVKETSVVLAIIANTLRFSGVDIFKNLDLSDGKFEILLLKSVNTKLFGTLMRDFLSNRVDVESYGDSLEVIHTNESIITFDNQRAKKDLCNDGDRFKIERDENLCLHYKIGGQIKMLLPNKDS